MPSIDQRADSFEGRAAARKRAPGSATRGNDVVAYLCRDDRRMGALDRGMSDVQLNQMIAEHRAPLLRYLRARGADDAEDLVQEVWVKVSRVDLTTIGEPKAYLYRVAHNLMIDQIRERQRRGAREHAFQDIYVGAEGVSHRGDAERDMMERQHLARIDRALAAQGPRTDAIFRRHRLDRIPQRVLAEELGVTLSAVEKQLQKAYRAIADAEREYQAERRGGRNGGE